jgi:histidine triad (HIT) family protein
MTDCIFCKIVAGDIPSARVYEDAGVVAFLDINPVNPGHTLVVPRVHVERLTDADESVVTAVAAAVGKCARAVMAATGAEGFNVLQNNGACAGQVVPHLHVHIIPRSASDGFRFGWRQGGYGEGELDAMRRRIAGRVS